MARADIGWEHGMKVVDKKVMCKHYKSTFSGGIYRLKHHLAQTRNDVIPCEKVLDIVRVQSATLLEESNVVSKKKRCICNRLR